MDAIIKKRRKKALYIILGIVIALGIIGNMLPESSTTDSKTESYQSYADLSSTVKVKSDKFVEQNLKYPDGWEYESDKVSRQDDTTYTFQAVVLAKNGFGVRSRVSYFVRLVYHGTKDQSHDLTESWNDWEVIKSDVSQ